VPSTMPGIRDGRAEGLELEAEREVRVGTLTTPVRLRIYRRASDGTYHLVQSHFLKTAIQYLPHAYGGPFGGTLEEALAEHLATVTAFFEQAVRRGYPPSEDWLVPNTLFEAEPPTP
jgi:hypothetical protein